MDKTQLLILMTPVVLFSLTVHEYSHGKVAYLLGDDTAKRMGRLTFNPLKHLDIVGVLFFYFVGFGWAKPVPVDWRNFQNPRRDMMYVALAGPLSNVALAVVCSVFIRLISPQENVILFVLLSFGVFINVALAIFNMLPVAPLDGGSVIKGLVSHEVAETISRYDRFGAVLILGIFLLDHFAHTGILGTILGLPINYSVFFLTQETFPALQQVLMASFR
ncbi:MAG: protease [Nitrospinaceae bacterium]|nr:MAG: protease [Nitrospinaceae bacterium]